MPHFVVVMVEPEFEESIGFMARAMKNFGLKELVLVNPRTAVGKVSGMRASHAQDVLDNIKIMPGLEQALKESDMSIGTTAQLASSLYRILRRPITPKGLAGALQNSQGIVALVFGREGTGLTNSELDLCDAVLTIPASLGYRTLNISHAAAIVFYELYLVVGQQSEVLANRKVKDTLLSFLEASAVEANISPRETGLALRSLRNVMGRSGIRAREASSLAGVFRVIAAEMRERARLS